MDDHFADPNDPTRWERPDDDVGWDDNGDDAEEGQPRRFNAAGSWGVRVLTERCGTCVFRPGNLMHLEPGRLQDMVHEALEADTAIICHATLDRAEQAVCRGFADAYDTTPLQLAQRLGMLLEVDPPPMEPS